MRACLSTIDLDEKSLVEKARQSPPMENRELASVVTTSEPYEFPAEGEERFHVVCFDFGVKRNSLRELAQLGVRTTVVPASTSAADVLALKPDGIFLSNGPGDPASMNKEVAEIRELLKRKCADVWDLFWTPVAGPRVWSKDVQAGVWTSRREPAGERVGGTNGGDHFTQSRLCGEC